MLSPKDLDHHLLFKKLVILKDEDPLVETEADSKAEETPETTEEVAQDLTNKPTEGEVETNENVETPDTTEEITVGKEEFTPLSPLAGSSVIICKKDQKDLLMAGGSNLSKIIFALELQKFQEHVYCIEDINPEQGFENGAFIWTIGLSSEEQSSLKVTENAKLIHSPYMEANMSKADKIKMYEPLKQFAASFHKS